MTIPGRGPTRRAQWTRVRDATPVSLPEEDARPILQYGEFIDGYRLPRSSNYTFFVRIAAGQGKYLPAIYKPRDGERPLWDFPQGTLYKREYAAFLLSRALGWPDIPLTLVRDGPHGVGSVQLYVDCDPGVTYFELIEEHREALQRFAVFDLLANNADRKAGHCLLGSDGRIWSVDHGLILSPTFKVRTVMLELWGQPIPEGVLGDVRRLLGELDTEGSVAGALAEVVTPQEVEALAGRLRLILERPVLPVLDPQRNVPWPWV